MVNDEQIKRKMSGGHGDRGCSYQMALMVTFRPGVRSWGTNSQWQLLLSSAMSSPGRLASKIRQRKAAVERFPELETRKPNVQEKTNSWIIVRHGPERSLSLSLFLVDKKNLSSFCLRKSSNNDVLFMSSAADSLSTTVQA